MKKMDDAQTQILSHVMQHALSVYNKTQNLLLGKPDMSGLSN
jgi:hypothetical protein